eukprot:jgi/Tetstr1/466188/TSEL_010748.t2
MQWAQNLGQRLRGYTTPADGPEQAAAQQRQESGRRGGGGARSAAPVVSQQGPSGLSVGSLVQQATSEMLMGPDWGTNMELIDAINRGGARGPGHAGEHALKHLKKPLTGSNPHVQILALTALEACMKNCGPEFHQKFAFNDTWAAIQMMAGKPGTDTTVSNKCLEMIEDWAHGLRFPSFQDAYDSMKRMGVNFPPHEIAKPGDFVAVQPAPDPGRAASGGGGEQHIPDGVSEEDRRAIQAAMAEFEAEAPERLDPPSAQPWHLDGSAALSWLPAAPSRPARCGAAPEGAYRPPTESAVLGTGPGATAAAAQPPPPPPAAQYSGPSLSAAQPAAQLMADLEAAQGTVGLFEEMLNIPDDNPGLVMQDHITEVADQVLGMRERLQALAETCSEERALMTTLALAERVEAALLRRDALVAAAAGGAARMPAQQQQQQQQQPAAAAVAAAAAPRAVEPAPTADAPRLAPPPRSSPQDAPLIDLMDDVGSEAATTPPSDGQAGAAFDPFLPMSSSAQQPTPDGSAHRVGLDRTFEELTIGDNAAAPADAGLFDGLTMASAAQPAAEDAKGKAPADPFAEL